VGNLTALRELALLWVADRVDEGMQRYRAAHGISDTWETRERVVVALTGGPEGATLIRRAARIAARGGAELLAVHVARGDGLTGADAGLLAAQRALAESLGASYHVVRGDDVPAALLDFARGVNATQLVLGASRRGSLLAWLTGPGVGSRTVRASGDIDVHIVTHEAAGTGRTRVGSTLTHGPRRRILSAAFAAGLLSVLCLALTALRRDLNPLSDALVFLLATVLVALIGGRVVAALTAVAASLLLNYFFTPPLHGFTIAERNNAIGLAVFVVVAIIVAVLVDRAERRRREAARASAESETLATVAGSVLRGRSQLPALLDQVREIFGADSVALLERRDRDWTVVAAAGNDPATRPEAADDLASVDEDTALAVRGPILDADARRTLTALAHQAAAALRTERLAVAADAGSALQAVDATRTALLRAVSHDLRTPLASAKAAVSSLRTSEDPSSAERVEWSTEDRRELLATADESLDALAELIGDLLDMSRLQAGVMAVSRQKVGVDAVIARALDDLGPAADGVAVTAAEDLPDVDADPGLLARIVANLVDNALRFSPPGSAPQVTASALGDRVEVRVVDRGPGLPPGAQERIFAPFQRLGDTSNTSGVGLGLALARGFAEGMGASVMPEETPGGGLTMVVSLPVAAMSPARPDPMTVRA
nr:DUF4118 domain-containing protein [Actinomycetota bacterium]